MVIKDSLSLEQDGITVASFPGIFFCGLNPVLYFQGYEGSLIKLTSKQARPPGPEPTENDPSSEPEGPGLWARRLRAPPPPSGQKVRARARDSGTERAWDAPRTRPPRVEEEPAGLRPSPPRLPTYPGAVGEGKCQE